MDKIYSQFYDAYYNPELAHLRLNERSFPEIIEHFNELLKDRGITIIKVLGTPNWERSGIDKEKPDVGDDVYIYKYDISFNFLGSNLEGITSMYSCKGTIRKAYSETYIGREILKPHFVMQYAWPTKKDMPNEIEVSEEVQLPIPISSEDKILWLGNWSEVVEAIYEPEFRQTYNEDNLTDTEFLPIFPYDNHNLKFLKLKKHNNGKWTVAESNDIEEIINADKSVYIRLYTSEPIFDYTESTYIKLGLRDKELEKVKSKIEEIYKLSKENGNPKYTAYGEYKEIFRTRDFMIYELYGEYRLVMDPKLLKKGVIPSFLLYENSCHIGFNGEVKTIRPVNYKLNDVDYEYGVCRIGQTEYEDNNMSIKCFGTEGIEEDQDKLYIVEYTDGRTEYLFTKDIVQSDATTNNKDSKKKIMRMVVN